MNYIGIDISSEHFYASKLGPQTNKYVVVEWPMTQIEQFVLSLDKQQDYCVMEATGVYHLGLLYHLIEQGYQASVVNPSSINFFRKMKGGVTKTDKSDATLIAQYALKEQEDLQLFQIPSQTITQLKQRRMLLNNLQTQLQASVNQLHAISKHPKPDVFTKHFLEDNQLALQQQIQQVKQSINELIDQDFSEQKDNLMSIPGFGEATANAFIEVVNSFEGIDKKNSTKAFVKFIGLAPTIHQSGTSVRKQSTISRSGAPLLRTKLFLPALSLCTRGKTDNVFKTFYRKLRGAGKSFKEAIVAVIHKMVRVAVAVIKNNTAFQHDFAHNQI
jgi:transposase